VSVQLEAETAFAELRPPLDEAAALLEANAPAVKQRVLEARRELALALDRAAKRASRHASQKESR